MSLPFRTLDDGRFGSARSDPYVDASFGAESGSYFLKSTPDRLVRPLSFKEYQLESDPRQPKKKLVRKKKTAAQVQTTNTATAQTQAAATSTTSLSSTPSVPSSSSPSVPTVVNCTQMEWSTLPYCTVSQTSSFLKDSIHYWTKSNDKPAFDSYWSVMTYNHRFKYVLLAIILAYGIYRVLRSC